MTREQESRYLRIRAVRVLNAESGAYSHLTRTLALGVLDLLEQRDQGVQLEADRVYDELAELRDEIAQLATSTVAASAWRKQTMTADTAIAELRLELSMLDERANSLARKLEQLEQHRDNHDAA